MALEKVDSTVQKLLTGIHNYNAEFKKWESRTAKIIRRYRDDQNNSTGMTNDAARFNILWSNVQTLIPAVYARMPKADVSRRFGDNDPVGRVASLLMRRTVASQTRKSGRQSVPAQPMRRTTPKRTGSSSRLGRSTISPRRKLNPPSAIRSSAHSGTHTAATLDA